MPLSIDIFRPDRIVIGVAHGGLTIADMQEFYESLMAGGAVNYRKIIDIVGTTTEMRKKDVAEFAAWLRAKFPEHPDGAIAIVANQRGEELAQLFAQLISDRQPARVFRSIRDARDWLHETTTVDLHSAWPK
jgi:hypothetical protein